MFSQVVAGFLLCLLQQGSVVCASSPGPEIVIVTSPVTWFEAVAQCDAIGGRLLQLTEDLVEDFNQFVSNNMTLFFTEYWIGYFRFHTEDVFRNISCDVVGDDSTFPWNPFALGECVAVSSSWGSPFLIELHGRTCSNALETNPFLCSVTPENYPFSINSGTCKRTSALQEKELFVSSKECQKLCLESTLGPCQAFLVPDPMFDPLDIYCRLYLGSHSGSCVPTSSLLEIGVILYIREHFTLTVQEALQSLPQGAVISNTLADFCPQLPQPQPTSTPPGDTSPQPTSTPPDDTSPQPTSTPPGDTSPQPTSTPPGDTSTRVTAVAESSDAPATSAGRRSQQTSEATTTSEEITMRVTSDATISTGRSVPSDQTPTPEGSTTKAVGDERSGVNGDVSASDESTAGAFSDVTATSEESSTQVLSDVTATSEESSSQVISDAATALIEISTQDVSDSSDLTSTTKITGNPTTSSISSGTQTICDTTTASSPPSQQQPWDKTTEVNSQAISLSSSVATVLQNSEMTTRVLTSEGRDRTIDNSTTTNTAKRPDSANTAEPVRTATLEGKMAQNMATCSCAANVKPAYNVTTLAHTLSKVIQATLKVNVTSLSVQRRRKESVPDVRPSSRALGWLGILLLALVFLLVIISDIRHLRFLFVRSGSQFQ